MTTAVTAPTAPRLQGTRVLLREWQADDLAAFAAMNADAEVMQHFPARLTRNESDAMAARLADHWARHGYGWWVLELPTSAAPESTSPRLKFAGCVGLIDVAFELPGLSLPQVEIGWRLPRAAWGAGYASEAAQLALAFARDTLRLPRVVSFTAVGNQRSRAVMERIGMVELSTFEHLRLPPGHPLRPHVLYSTPSGD